jgi:hypothetical protein
MALLMMFPLIAGDFFVVKFLAILAFCLEIVITENLYIQKGGNWQNVELKELLDLLIKIVVLLLAFEQLIMSLLDE